MERNEILLRLRERIVAFAASRIARDAAEDLAQETLMLLHDKYAHVTRLEELFPLSMQIMRFKMVAMRRKSYRRGEAGQVPHGAGIWRPRPSCRFRHYWSRRRTINRCLPKA